MNLERDPREWVILEEDEKRVVFVAGNGVKIRTSKKGNIYQEWLREMKRIAEGGPVVEPVVEMQEGVVIEPVWVDRSYAPPSAEDRKHREVQEKEDQEQRAQRRVDNLELSELHRRLEQLRNELRDRLWCQHEKDFCTGRLQDYREDQGVREAMLGRARVKKSPNQLLTQYAT